MASCITSQWIRTAPQVKLTVDLVSNTGTSETYNWTLQYIADYPANASSRDYTVTIDGAVVKSGSYNIDGVTGTKTIASGTKMFSKGTSAQTKTFSVSFAFELSWSGSYCGTRSASGSFAVAKKTSYTVSFNANGGIGAPGSQTKWWGTNLTLSTTKPTRTGYSFLGWSASSTATSATWSAGASYTANASDVLYAVWKANTYTVSYSANGGTGAPDSQIKIYGTTLVLSGTKPTRSNYNFVGWGTSATSTSVAYAAGASYASNSAITLYAIWSLSYTKPRISKASVIRCTSAGVASDSGTHFKAAFSWECDKPLLNIVVQYKKTSVTTWTSITYTPGGTSGNFSQVIGGGNIVTDSTFDVQIVIADSVGNTTTNYTVSGLGYVIDLKSGGTGVAFGKPAETNDLLDVAWNTRIRKNLQVDGNVTTNNFYGKGLYLSEQETGIYGKAQDGSYQIAMHTSGDVVAFGYGQYVRSLGSSQLYGNVVQILSKSGTIVNGTLTLNNGATLNSHITFKNNAGVRAYATTGENVALCSMNQKDDMLFGYGTYGLGRGTTNIYGHQLTFTTNNRINTNKGMFIGGKTAIEIYTDLDNESRFIGSGWLGFRARNKSNTLSDTLQFILEDTSAPRSIFRSQVNNRVFLGSSTYRFNTIFITNAVNASDLKIKENIATLDGKRALDFVMELNPIEYTLKHGEGDSNGTRKHLGFGAQEVVRAAGIANMGNLSLYQAVVVDENGEEHPYDPNVEDEHLRWGLNYTELIAPLVKTVQLQQQKIESLEQRLSVLEESFTKMK